MLFLSIDLHKDVKCWVSIRKPLKIIFLSMVISDIPHITQIKIVNSDKKNKRARLFTYFKCTSETPLELVCL
jgi:hypothetical protein